MIKIDNRRNTLLPSYIIRVLDGLLMTREAWKSGGLGSR